MIRSKKKKKKEGEEEGEEKERIQSKYKKSRGREKESIGCEEKISCRVFSWPGSLLLSGLVIGALLFCRCISYETVDEENVTAGAASINQMTFVFSHSLTTRGFFASFSRSDVERE